MWLSCLATVASETCDSGNACTGAKSSCGSGSPHYCCTDTSCQIQHTCETQAGAGDETCSCVGCGQSAPPDAPGATISTTILSATLVSTKEGQTHAGLVTVQQQPGQDKTLALTYSAGGFAPNATGSIEIGLNPNCDPAGAAYFVPPSGQNPWDAAVWTADQSGHVAVTLVSVVCGYGVDEALNHAISLRSSPQSQPGAGDTCGVLTNATATDDSSSDGLDGWHIGLIVLACLLGLALCALAVALYCIVRKRSRHAHGQGDEDGVIIVSAGETTIIKNSVVSDQIALSEDDNDLNGVRLSQDIPVYSIPTNVTHATAAVNKQPPTPRQTPIGRETNESVMSPDSSNCDSSAYA